MPSNALKGCVDFRDIVVAEDSMGIEALRCMKEKTKVEGMWLRHRVSTSVFYTSHSEPSKDAMKGKAHKTGVSKRMGPTTVS